MGLFKSKRQKLLETYNKIFNVVQIYGGVYGYLLKSGAAEDAGRFKRAYDDWRQVSPLLVNEGTPREEVCRMLDEFFNAAVTNEDIIKEDVTNELAKKEEERLIAATQHIRDIVAKYP